MIILKRNAMLVYPYDFVESATEEDSLSCRKDQNHFKSGMMRHLFGKVTLRVTTGKHERNTFSVPSA